MGDFLGVVLLIILGFYVLGKILKYVLPLWLAKKMRDFQAKGGGSFAGGFGGSEQRNNGGNRQKSREGEVKISRTEVKERRINDDVGEYVEFDEVK